MKFYGIVAAIGLFAGIGIALLSVFGRPGARPRIDLKTYAFVMIALTVAMALSIGPKSS